MENELKTTNKAVDFLNQHAVLLLAILIGALTLAFCLCASDGSLTALES